MEPQKRPGVKPSLQHHLPDKHLGDESAMGIGTPLASRLIGVQGEQDTALGTHGCDNQPFLLLTHGAAHECYHILSAALPELEDREESLDDNEAFARVLHGAVQIEEHQALPEVWRELVLALPRWRLPEASAGIGDELAGAIVDRDHDAVMHDAFAGMIPQPEYINGRFFEAAFLGEVGVSIVKVLERERERRVGSLPGFLWGWLDVHNWSRNFSGR